jgi:hypothetical protein
MAFYIDSIGAEPTDELDFACECERPGCELSAASGLREAARERGEPLLAH